MQSSRKIAHLSLRFCGRVGTIFEGMKLLPVMKIWESLLLFFLGAVAYQSRFSWWWQGFQRASRNKKAFLRPTLRTGILSLLLSLCLLRRELQSYTARGMREGFQTFHQPRKILRSKPFSVRHGSITSAGCCSLYLLPIERAASCQTAGTNISREWVKLLVSWVYWPPCGHRTALNTERISISRHAYDPFELAVMGNWLGSSALYSSLMARQIWNNIYSKSYFGFQQKYVVYLDMIYYHFQNNILIIYCVFVQTQRDIAQIPLKRIWTIWASYKRWHWFITLVVFTLIWQEEQGVPSTLHT